MNRCDITLPNMLTRSLDLLPDPYHIQTHEGHILYANQPVAKLCGLKSVKHMIDKMDFEIPARIFEDHTLLNTWHNHDREIVEKRKTLAMLEVHPHAVNLPYIIRKTPFYNNENQCIGVFCAIKYLETFTVNDYIKGKLPGSLLLNKPDEIFTEKESEIIFFKLQGMTSKQISKLLSLSPRTIENRLANMYNKAGVNHFDDFRHFCENLNFHRYLPRRLLAHTRIGFEGDYEEDIREN